MPQFYQSSKQKTASPTKQAKEKPSPASVVNKEEILRKIREPPQKPAFANDGKNLNLENHDMLLKILNHKFAGGADESHN